MFETILKFTLLFFNVKTFGNHSIFSQSYLLFDTLNDNTKKDCSTKQSALTCVVVQIVSHSLKSS